MRIKIFLINTMVLVLTLLPFSSSAQTGNLLFNDTLIHTIEITFLQSNYWNLLVNNKSYDDANDSSTYIPSTVIIDGGLLDSVGIQFKGNSSYYNYPGSKKPFTLSFNEYIDTQKYDGLKAINLNNGYQDPTMLREKMFLDFCNQVGINAPRGNYAKLYINGNYWGLYLMVERVDKKFLNNRFGNNGGNLFKGDGNSSSCANLEYHGIMSPYYNCYTLKTNETANDWTDLVKLTYNIGQTTATQFYDSVNSVLNTTSFIKAWAAYNLFADFDSYPYRFKHNYYIYHNSVTNKFEWIVWDASTAFGTDIPMSVPVIENISLLYLTPPADDAPLTYRMLSDSMFRTQYLQTVCEMVNNSYSDTSLNLKVDTLANRIRADFYADPNKIYTNQNFEDNLVGPINLGSDYPGLKSFITNRYAAVLSELDSLGITCSTSTTTVPMVLLGEEVNFYPNPAQEAFIIEVGNTRSNNGINVVVYDILGRGVYKETLNTGKYIVNSKNWKKGLYLVVITSPNEMSTKKLIIE